MAFKLELATYEDIDTLIDVYFHAFAADPLYPYLYPNLSWEEKVKFETSGPKRVFKEQPWTKLYKLTEEKTGYVFLPNAYPYPPEIHPSTQIDIFHQIFGRR